MGEGDREGGRGAYLVTAGSCGGPERIPGADELAASERLGRWQCLSLLSEPGRLACRQAGT